MIRVGVGVEGRSDLEFWRKYLHREFQGCHFDVCNMNGREKLIASTPKLLDTFHSAGYRAGIIILDRDKDPCIEELRKLFTVGMQAEFRKPLEQRYLFLCTAVRKIECWFLADHQAVIEVLPDVSYELPDDTGKWGVGKLKKLWKEQYSEFSTLNKIEFARQIAPRFSATRGSAYSASLKIAWERIQFAVKQASTD